ncbi:MAG: outer membrane protein assembly factor BamD [Chromatiales bacterium]|nr:outer membrane protein assembly factor BamD [Chromatiales bacterium]
METHAHAFSRPRGALLTLAALLCIVVTTGGCANRSDRDLQSVPDVLYERAQRAMATNNFRNAITFYEALIARYPFSNQARQAQLDLIYAFYRNGDRESAIDAAIQFERENPTHPRVDYALYMRGRANFRGERSWFHRWFNIDLTRRPPLYAEESLSAFSQLLNRFPNSAYAPDARQRMIFLRNFLAEHENHVARFYLERGAYLAALNRAKFAVETFPGAPATAESLGIMVEAYRRVGMADLAEDTRRVLRESYPELADNILQRESPPWYRFW